SSTQAASFTLTAPASGSYTVGQSMTITWTANNVPANGTISLALDKDKKWNGNEYWIEIDKVNAANGNGSLTWDTTGVAAGTYYVGGYLYNNATKTPIYSRLATPITIANNQTSTTQPASFTLTAPASGSFALGQTMNIAWTAANVPANCTVSLALDKDGTWWNGNEYWIEIDKVTAANGNGSYTWNIAGVAPGTYYVGGYLYNNAASKAVFSRLATPITIASASTQSQPASSSPTTNAFNVTASVQPTSDTVSSQASVVRTRTNGAGSATSTISIANKDLLFSSSPVTASNSRQLIDAANSNVIEQLLIQPAKNEELTAIDTILRDQDTWLEYF
ncbi:MAG TPA: hypothetical protein VIH42_11395, partial [Thermoguttaceae bacterium]